MPRRRRPSPLSFRKKRHIPKRFVIFLCIITICVPFSHGSLPFPALRCALLFSTHHTTPLHQGQVSSPERTWKREYLSAPPVETEHPLLLKKRGILKHFVLLYVIITICVAFCHGQLSFSPIPVALGSMEFSVKEIRLPHAQA